LETQAKSNRERETEALNVPPPNPLLPKRIIPDEPVKTGFTQKFIELRRFKKFESERAPLGKSKVVLRQPGISETGLVSGNGGTQGNNNNGNEETNASLETSLRHFFYLEYRKTNLPKYFHL